MAQDPSWQKWLRIREARIQLDALEIAPRDSNVIRWRLEAFADRDGRLLDDVEVEGWVERFEDLLQVPDMSDARARLRYYKERDALPKRWWIESARSGPAGRWSPPSGEGFEVYPKPGSLLDEGLQLAESLAARFGWTEASGNRWLLTGVLPTARPIAEIQPPAEQQKTAPWREVVLRIPVEIPPDAVAELYQSVRAGAISNLKGVPLVKNTPIAERNLKAAVFAAERSQSGASWGDVCDEWTNYAKSLRKGKEWSFASTQSFISAVRKTYSRLTGRELQWKRKRGERK